MNIVLTKHAREVLDERSIAMEWLMRVIETPARVEPDPKDARLEHRLGRVQEHGDRVLRIIVTRGIVPPRVITAYFDRTMKDRL